MEVLIILLIVLVVLLVGVTLIGHGVWLVLAWFARELFGGRPQGSVQTLPLNGPAPEQCSNCHTNQFTATKHCPLCGAARPTPGQEETLRELDATLRQLERMCQAGALDEVNFRVLRAKLQNEREQITFPRGRPGSVVQPSLFSPATAPRKTAQSPSDPAAAEAKTKTNPDPVPTPAFDTPATFDESAHGAHEFGAWADYNSGSETRPPIAKPPRRPFSEVLASFMEESNIRWGEIVGGVLIVGCSTALVVSLWTQIASIPVLKFLIFTGVTAALFGVGFYTEHRWKLPTTSFGILTIAVLLVPLNFLAIAAVSGGTAPSGALVIASEIVAPALFLCLVYFAGRVITSLWPHVLAASVLGSSIGQLLVRHFASPESSPARLFALGIFPVLCYVAATAWMLKRVLADKEIDEREANEIFVTLGAISFAAALPFGLLLYRAGPVSMSLIYLAPVVTLAGTPMLAGGAILWRRVLRKDLAWVRTTGTSIALVGTLVVLAGMFLSWPNPESIVPAALLNFAVFTAIAIWLELPSAHGLAAGCLAFAYVIAFQVLAGHVPWRNLRVTSLWQTANSIGTGRALVLPFVAFTLAHEWLKRKQRLREAASYFFAACGIAVPGLALVIFYGAGVEGDPSYVSAILAFYAASAFWFAWSSRSVIFTWVGTALLFLTSAQVCGSLLAVRFPWQATFLLFAAITISGALGISRYGNSEDEKLFLVPLRRCAIPGSVFAMLFLLAQMIAEGVEPAGLFATRTFFLGAIWFGLVIIGEASIFFTAFQMTLTLGAILATKSFLQRFDWYGFQPHAWLHPWALQIQVTVLGLFCLAWIALRLLLGMAVLPPPAVGDEQTEGFQNKSNPAFAFKQARRILLELPIAFDHLLAAALLFGFAVLICFGSISGISRELTNAARTPPIFDLSGFPHELIFSFGSWICLGVLLAVMFGNLRERRRGVFVSGLVVGLWAACFLLAGKFETQFAAASAARWALAILLLAVSITYALREKVFGAAALAVPRGGLVRMRIGLLLLILSPLFFLTISPVVDAINYVPARGPQTGIFYVMGAVLLYSVPLIFVAAALAIHGIAERSAWFIFASGLVVNLSVVVVQIVSVTTANGLMNRVVLVEALQLMAISAACFGLVWIATRVWWMPGVDSPGGRERWLLNTQKFMPVVLNTWLILPTALHLVAVPYRASRGTFAAGGFNGWLAVWLTAGVVVAFDKRLRQSFTIVFLSGLMLACGSLAAFGTARFGVVKWAGLHIMLGALVLIAWSFLLIGSLPHVLYDDAKPFGRWCRELEITLEPMWEWKSIRSATVIGSLVVLVAMRGPLTDPLGAWWSIAALLSMSALAAVLNFITWQRFYLFAAAVLCNISFSIWLIKYQSHQTESASAFLEANVFVLALASILWLWLDLSARRKAPVGSSAPAASLHNLAALLSLMAMMSIIASRLFADFLKIPHQQFPRLDWVALISLLMLMGACVWDRQARFAVAGIYLLGLVMAVGYLDYLALAPRHLAWSLMMAGAIQALIAAIIWRARAPVIAWTRRLKIPERIGRAADELAWLRVMNTLVIGTVTSLAFWIDLRFFDWYLRMAAAVAVGAQAFSFGLMAQGRNRLRWQRAACSMLILSVIFFGWSCLAPGTSGTWLNRAVIAMALMFAIVAVFGAGLDKLIEREPDWTKAFRDTVPAMTITGIVALGFVLCTEVYFQIEFGAVHVKPLALFTVALTLAAAAVICILFALSPKHDPLGLSEAHRSRYVYVAEMMMALLFMHIRLTMPWWFTGFFERYWPLVVVGFAYAGVAASEALRRRNVLVLAHPLERTGVVLPLLPVAGYWLAQSQVDYSTLLFVVGGLYGLLSILRKSFWFGLVAALTGNGGLWHLLHHTSEYRFWQHPQLWLIPAAVSVLIAAYVNRRDFTETQMTGIRYLALVTIYVSSTADIFINGVARSPWLPLVLAALSLAGVFGGMLFHIRAFLLLGSIFLLLAIGTMINYASVNLGWTWLWYVAGIATGAAIIATFAVFEKKREDVLRVVDGLKEWDG